MLGFLEDLSGQVILLLVAGAIWVIGRIAAAAQQIRQRTRARMERQEEQRTLRFEERSEYTAEPAVQGPGDAAEIKPASAIRRPPPPKRRTVRRRVIRRTVHRAAPQHVTTIRERLRVVQGLRDAIVLREILGPPKALRGRRAR